MSSSAVLHGLDLESEHCMFQNQNGKVTLIPLGGAQCSVNGVQVTEPSQLNQGETTQTVLRSSVHVDLLRPPQRRSPHSVLFCSRRRHPARQDQHVPLQPSEGGGQAAGETQGEAACSDAACRGRGLHSALTPLFPPSERPSVLTQPLHDGSVQVL